MRTTVVGSRPRVRFVPCGGYSCRSDDGCNIFGLQYIYRFLSRFRTVGTPMVEPLLIGHKTVSSFCFSLLWPITPPHFCSGGVRYRLKSTRSSPLMRRLENRLSMIVILLRVCTVLHFACPVRPPNSSCVLFYLVHSISYACSHKPNRLPATHQHRNASPWLCGRSCVSSDGVWTIGFEAAHTTLPHR